jgi:LacI family repressor for deo operon, udp, cdd, tsx, nupC, and nupG
MVGIVEVAKLAGVSVASVSRALNGKQHVSKKLRSQVEKAATELGYIPSANASSLASGQTKNVGIIVPFMNRWFFSSVLEGAISELSLSGYDSTVYLLSGGTRSREKVFSDQIMRKRIDGIIAIALNPSQAELANLISLDKPIVEIGGQIPGLRALQINDEAVGRLATEHLIALGHTKIGMIAGVQASALELHQPYQRKLGYLNAMAAAGLDVMDEWVTEADYTMPGAYDRTKQILGDPRLSPTALVCASDEMGFGAILAARDLGLRVPEDVSVIGIDGNETGEFFGLTTVSQDPREQGVQGVRILVDRLTNAEVLATQPFDEVMEWPTRLVVRSSTAKPLQD